MDYRIERRESQRFIAMIKSFPNVIINDESDRSIPEFWDECYEKDLIAPIHRLRPDGKRDLYGLCSPQKDDNGNFEYGIGVVLDEETDMTAASALMRNGYRIWQTAPADYVVFKCMGDSGECISAAWNRFYQEFLPQTGYQQTELTDYEIYFEKKEAGMFCELWIPIGKNAE